MDYSTFFFFFKCSFSLQSEEPELFDNPTNPDAGMSWLKSQLIRPDREFIRLTVIQWYHLLAGEHCHSLPYWYNGNTAHLAESAPGFVLQTKDNCTTTNIDWDSLNRPISSWMRVNATFYSGTSSGFKKALLYCNKKAHRVHLRWVVYLWNCFTWHGFLSLVAY